MAFRRKRKPKVVWLPPAAENRFDLANPAVSSQASGSGVIALTGTLSLYQKITGFSPLVSDIDAIAFQTSGLPTESLADIYSSGYRLRRIVGKIYVSTTQSSVAVGNVPEYLVTVGLIVLRVDDTGQPLSAATPETYDPQVINSWADPWIWRRTWMLSDFAEATALGYTLWPENNAQYGSVMDGPHVDAKTARVLGREERLFLVASMMPTRGVAGGGAGDAEIRINWDLRFVGSLRQNVGNRRNASR